LHADIFVIGEDRGKDPHNVDVESHSKNAGKKIIKVLYNPRTSSTRIKQSAIAQSHRRNYSEQAVA
jgi:glycerol-3-phosphate cytidylyltransferase